MVAPPSGMLSGLFGRKSAGAGALARLDGLAGLPDEVISALETRAIWAKFGFEGRPPAPFGPGEPDCGQRRRARQYELGRDA